MRIALLTVLLSAPAGGTALRIPVEGVTPEKVRALSEGVERHEFEFFQCPCGKDQPDAWRYDACAACGKAWKPVRKTGPMRVHEYRGELSIIHGGDMKVLWVVRLSEMEALIRAAGMEPRRKGKLHGPFAVHVGEKAGKLGICWRRFLGVSTAEFVDGVIYVHQDRGDRPLDYEALEKSLRGQGLSILDLSWVVHRCYGEIGFLR